MRRALASVLAVHFFLLASAAFAQADDKLFWVAHGQDVTAAKVGPAAAGYKTLKVFAGGEIKKSIAYPFARWIEKSATYDGFEVPTAHLLIEGAAFSSALDISAPFPVVLRGVTVRLAEGSPWGILMRPSSGGVYVLWSDVGGMHDKLPEGQKPVDVAIDLRGASGAVYHSRASNALDGIHVSGSGARIEQSLIDNLVAVPQSHNDGIQLLGAPENVRIIKNKIINRNPQTSCLYLLGRRLTVTGNYLAGGGWTVYAGARNNGHGGDAGGPVVFTDNVFGKDIFAKGGSFGPVAYWDKDHAGPGDWLDNRFSDGTPVKP